MISLYQLQETAKRQQTTELNVRREYVQHVFLSRFYRQSVTDTVYFKGGTALRLVFGSPRFSEDLDFSTSVSDDRRLEDALLTAFQDIEREGIGTNIISANKTSGGYLAELIFLLGSERIPLVLQFSKRKPNDTGEVITINSDMIASYTVVMLARNRLVVEKIRALLARAKPRDFYDLYFLIRSGLLGKNEKQLFLSAKEKLRTVTFSFDQELKKFLPKSHWPVIGDFPNALEREIDRYL